MFIFADMKIIRTIAAALLVAALSVPAFASEMKGDDENKKQESVMVGDDYQIVRNEIVDGIRYVSAVPSQKVCSSRGTSCPDQLARVLETACLGR